jgi:predicted lipoprotein with Yx(FWY)xxD motif
MSNRNRNRTRTIVLAAGLGLSLTLAACGGDDQADVAAASATADESAAEAAAPDTADTPATIDVLIGESSLGEVLVGPDGRTLYGFTNDVDALSTCYGTCADAWPPVIVSDDWTAGPGLDFGIFATTVREDGQSQLVAGRWPLYYFAGDAVPGDVNGQGSGDVWFAVDLQGGLITDDAPADADATDADATDADHDDEAADDSGDSLYGSPDDGDGGEAAGPALVGTATTDLGDVLVDGDGLTLYGFLDDRDVDGSVCNDACADAWPPVIVDGDALPAGLDPEVFSIVTRDDGTNQLAAGIWPLYRFAGDAGPGDINGQGSGDVWFAATPTGGLVGAP